MSSHSATKKEVNNVEEIPIDEEVYHLSGDAPFFDMVMTLSFVNKHTQLFLPKAACSMLPSEAVPVVLRHGGRSWVVTCSRSSDDRRRPCFDGSRWRSFVEDNCLKCGDGCVFELIDSNPALPVFKVHILRGDLPPELLEKARAPIIID